MAQQHCVQGHGLENEGILRPVAVLAGDRLDIAYSPGMNDHPEFGGLELTLRDVMRAR